MNASLGPSIERWMHGMKCFKQVSKKTQTRNQQLYLRMSSAYDELKLAKLWHKDVIH